MHLVYQLREVDGKSIYTHASLIGIHQEMNKAREDLLNFLAKHKYVYLVELDDGTELFIRCLSKGNVTFDDNNTICFEIRHRNLTLNNISIY